MNKKHDKLNLNTEEILKNSSLKITKNRLRVLEFLISESKPLSIEEIFRKLKTINQVTIYRIIDQFVKKGLVSETNLRTGRAYFEFQKHHHHHIVCTQCGSLEEIELCVPDSYLNKIKKQARNFKKIQEHALEFFGVCMKCDKI